MRNIIIFVILCFCSSCGLWNSVPMADEFGQFERGCSVKVKKKNGSKSQGELLVENSQRIVLLSKESELVSIRKDNIKELKILFSYTHSERDTRQSNLIGAMTIGHGWWLVFTLPLNAISIASINKSAYVIEYKNSINWKNVSMYARFPRGLPKGVNLSDLTLN